jgi:hypothetical protein
MSKIDILDNSVYKFIEYYDFLKIIMRMMDSNKNITIDTGIYKNYNNTCDGICDCFDSDCELLPDEKPDIIKIKCKNKPLLFEDVMKIFDKIHKQLIKLDKLRCCRPGFFYTGMDYHEQSNICFLKWDTEDGNPINNNIKNY